MLLFAGCLGDPKNIGVGALPPEDIVTVHFTDTMPVEIGTIRVDSVNTLNVPRQMIGNYTDREFGHLHTETYTQFFISNNLVFGDSSRLVFDSLVLKLGFSGEYFGRLDMPQTLRVYELEETVPDSGEVYSTRRLKYDRKKDLADGYVLEFSESGGPKPIAIHIDESLGKKLLYADSTITKDRELFREFFKGLAIATDSISFFNREPGAIFNLDLSSAESELVLFYTFKSDTADFERVETFAITSTTPKFHHIRRTRWENESLLGMHIPSNPTEPDTDSILEFLQFGALIYPIIKFPGLDSFGDFGIVRAELVLPTDKETYGEGNQFLPPEMLPVLADENGEPRLLDNGFPFPVIVNNAFIQWDPDSNAYSIVMNFYVQEIVSGAKKNDGILLFPANSNFLKPTEIFPGTAYRTDRVVLHGTANPNRKPILRITYSTLPR